MQLRGGIYNDDWFGGNSYITKMKNVVQENPTLKGCYEQALQPYHHLHPHLVAEVDDHGGRLQMARYPLCSLHAFVEHGKD